MGLFSSFVETLTGGISDVIGAVAGGVSQVAKVAAPIVQTIAPLAAPIFSQFLAGSQQQQLLQLQLGQGGSGAIAAANQLTPRTPIGFQGNQVPGANPIARAAFFPPFDQSRLPSRPVFGAFQQQLAQFPQFQPPQTTSFRQQGFGAPVAPSFRPFTPSFRSGQLGTQGQFFPGVSQGFDPRFGGQQFAPQRPAQPVGFGGFGGFGRFFSAGGGFNF